MADRRRLDNTLALGQVVGRLERARMGWRMQHDPAEHDPDLRYELVILAGPAAGTYHGSTATMAATAAQDALDDHKVGWTT